MSTKTTGNSGERFAFSLLEKNGYKIISKNFRSFVGEIDAIAVKDDTLIFVEVKTRKSGKFGLPEEAVTPWKLHKIATVGEYFVKITPGMPKRRRIDVVSLVVKDGVIVASKIIKAI